MTITNTVTGQDVPSVAEAVKEHMASYAIKCATWGFTGTKLTRELAKERKAYQSRLEATQAEALTFKSTLYQER